MFAGFAYPEANWYRLPNDGFDVWATLRQQTGRARSHFFKVPALWTDMSARLSSEVALLSVEYLFRHTWGWETWDGRACWLTEDELACGWRYATGEEPTTPASATRRAVHDVWLTSLRCSDSELGQRLQSPLGRRWPGLP